VRTRYREGSGKGGRTLVVTCTHTIEQVRFVYLDNASKFV